MFFSCWLLARLSDIVAFRIVAFTGFVSYAMLITFQDNATLTYIAVFLLITSIGGWNNVFLLIMEMRVPPSNIAAVAIIIRTIATACGIMAATVAALDPILAYIVLFSVAICGFLASLCLPPAG